MIAQLIIEKTSRITITILTIGPASKTNLKMDISSPLLVVTAGGTTLAAWANNEKRGIFIIHPAFVLESKNNKPLFRFKNMTP